MGLLEYFDKKFVLKVAGQTTPGMNRVKTNIKLVFSETLGAFN